MLVGDGPARPEIESQIAELGISDNVRVLGRRNDVPRIMTASDVFLFPSFHEGLPVVSLEACACQLPLVGSRIPGTTESIVDGETGFLHDVEDESSMAASVLRLLNEPETAERIRRAANDRIEKYFSRSASASSLKQLYANVVIQQRRRRSA
ncbi:MAG: glycosyltransferase [Planctomycetota bacterium]